MKLTETDKTNPLWARLQQHLTERLEYLRMQNDNRTLDEVSTAILRGRIAEVKGMLDLDKESPEVF